MLRIRPMDTGDIDLGMQLKSEAGWNQTRGDWQRFLDLAPGGCFVALWDERPVGTVTTCVFDTVAWIGMMLVDGGYRRRGIGKGLMRHALDSLDPQRVRSVRLDATPLGRPLYLSLGFHDQYDLIRYGGQPRSASVDAPLQPVGPADVQRLASLDQAATGVDRSGLLARLVDEQPPVAAAYPDRDLIEGFLLSRPGCQAIQIGPCIARSDAVGTALLQDALCRLARREVYVDVAEPHRAAAAAVESAGLQPRRQFTRHVSRPGRARRRLPWLWASSGPEKG